MKRLYFSKLVILLTILSGFSLNAIAQLTQTFSYTGTQQSYTVPLGVFSIVVDMQGAQGGTNTYYSNSGTGGCGGRVQCTMNTTPGQVLIMTVGGQGLFTPGTSVTFTPGGYNGGGGENFYYAASGGGASDIRSGGNGLNNRVIVAGGGGGGGYGYCCGVTYCVGGKGGGLTGETGYFGGTTAYSGNGTCYNAKGGDQSAGGIIGTCGSGMTAGTFGVGGTGTASYYGGGGGGGWYGGAGAYYGGGGGGSSYTDGSVVPAISVTHTQGTNCSGNGVIAVTGNCTPPVAGAIVGPSLICGIGGTVLYSNPTGSTGGVWTSSNTSVATINSSNGILTTIATGTTVLTSTITYACGVPAIATATVVVSPNPAPITGVASMCVGSTAALSDNGGGTWSTSNTGLATVTTGPGFGVVTGLVASNPIITYTLASGCATTTTTTVYPSPAAISGPSVTCYGVPITMSDATPGGTWASSSPVVASISTGGVVTGTGTGATRTTNIIYTEPTHNCTSSQTVTINLLPTPYTLALTAGSSDRCSNGAGLDLNLNSSDIGTNYQIYRNGVAFGSTFPGTGGVINWLGMTDAGTYTVIATNTATGCTGPTAGSPVINVYQAPTIHKINFSGTPSSICNTPGASMDLLIDTSQAGFYYSIYINGSISTVFSGAGTYPDVLGSMTTPGTYLVTATDPTNALGCTDTMTNSPVLSIMPLPQVDTVTGGGSYCPGPSPVGVHVKLVNSLPGINYNLYLNGVYTGTTLPGSSSSLDFGALTAVGTYSVVAVNSMTGCQSDMFGTATVSKYIPPVADTLQGGGSYCAAGAGIHLYMNTTQSGVQYQLWNAGLPVGAPTTGTGSTPEDLGVQFLGGTYTAIATDPVTHCSTNMIGTALINIDPLPIVETVNPGGSYCLNGAGVDITMNPSDPTISYQLYYNGSPLPAIYTGTGSALDFAYHSIAGNYTVVATNPVTGCTSNMAGVATVAINPLPTHYTVTGGGNYCTGSTGAHVGLLFSGLGVNYQLYDNGSMVGSAIPGSSSALDFGAKTATGTYTVIGTNTVTGCSDTMANSVVITNTPPPTIFAVTASGSSYCSGDPGIDIQLSSSQAGVNYQFFRTGLPVGTTVAGTGLSLDFGLQTLPGAYTITAVDGITGCTSTMFGSAVVTINALPTTYTVTGGGNFCAGGTGVHVGISNSDTWIAYQLYINGVASGSSMWGTGAALDFGVQTTAGTYQILGWNPLTTCSSAMLGSVTVTPKPAPTPYAVTGTAGYCAGGTGVSVGLAASDLGTTYQLYNGATAVGSAVTGSSSSLDFGIHAAGTYTVVATTTASGCSGPMTGSAVVTANPLPVAYTVFGGGSFCAGSTGVHVMLSGSALGTNYQLYNSGTPVGTFVTATGTVLDLGVQTTSGTYTVVGTDAITGCTNNMVASASVSSNPLPTAYSVTTPGTGHYCAGMSGVHVGLGASIAGINYQLYRAGTPVSMLPGDGLSLDFGLETGAGNYTVVGTDGTTGCMKTMTGSVDVVIDPVAAPTITVSTGIGDTVCAGNVYTFTPTTTNAGSAPTYIWKINGTSMGFGSSYSYVPSNGDVVSVQLTSSAPCAIPSTATATDIITVRPYVTPSATITADPGTAVCKAIPVTFTATPAGQGYAPVYNWIVNSVIDPAVHGTTYTFTPKNNDVIIFMLGSSYPCRLADTVFSNTFKMEVDAAIAPTVGIIASGTTSGTTLTPGQLDTFTAVVSNGGLNPKFQWSLNGMAIAGATNSKYISSEFFNNDSLSCEVVSSGACGLSSYNSILLTVKRTAVGQLTTSVSDINVLPNPNKGEFTIKGSLGTSIDEEVSLEITNMIGQVVYSNKVAAHGGNINEHIKLSNNIANGMYILSVRSGAQNNVYHVVIEQ